MKVDCSLTVNYFKERDRMCEYYSSGNTGCDFCPLGRTNDCSKTPYVSSVQSWSDTHQKKTRLDDFIEKYPYANLDENGYPEFCIHQLDGCWNRDCIEPFKCNDCVKKYWDKEIDENE